MTQIDTWQAVVLGVVEGLTEFLPVSSTAHLKISESLLGLPVADAGVVGFTAVVQAGAVAAVLVYFAKDLWALTSAGLRGLVVPEVRSAADFKLAWWIVVATIPLALVGVLAKSAIEGPLASLWVVAGSLLLGSAYMTLGDRRAVQDRVSDEPTFRQAMLIGGSQVFALLLPGFSRSGASISTGLLLGLDRVRATRLSFLFAIPALTGAALYELKDASSAGSTASLGVAVAVAFVVAFASVAWLLRFVAGHGFTVFVRYRVLLAIALLCALALGLLDA